MLDYRLDEFDMELFSDEPLVELAYGFYSGFDPRL